MIDQLRIYTVREENWDEWIAFFEGTVRPLLQKNGVPVPAAWRASDSIQSEDGEVRRFVWIRQFTSIETASSELDAYRNSPERKALDPALWKDWLVKTEAMYLEDINSSTAM
jgi:hypothetical protein